MHTLKEGSLEVKLPTTWTDEKHRWEEAEKKAEEKVREEKINEEKVKESQEKEDAGARTSRKVAKHCDFGSGGSKSGLAKSAGAEPAG